MSGPTGARLVHDAAADRYVLTVDGTEVGHLDYRERDGLVELVHAEVDPRRRGQGLAAVLVDRALALLRAEGRRVVPLCGYVAAHVRDHPEHHDLVAEPSAGTLRPDRGAE